MAALVIGLAAGVVCFYGITIKDHLGYDDSLDAVGVHGLGGIFGALATGVLASKAINPAGANGLIYGNASLLGVQAISVLAAAVYAFVVTWIVLKILDKTMGLRVQDEQEQEGLDLSQHGETGYNF
jgi:Amt family ammonium transporter